MDQLTTEPGPASATAGLLAGRRGVVLGVSGVNSIGYQVARTLHELGAQVAVTCRPPRLAGVALLAAELDATAYPVDVADESSLAAAFAAIDRVGHAGYAGNAGHPGNAGNAGNAGNPGNAGHAVHAGDAGNAGPHRPLDFVVHCLVDIPDGVLGRSLLEVSRADFEHVMAVSAWSLIAACRHARPLLARSTAPRVVALTSACSHRMTPHYHVAGIAKAALESAVIYLAMQLGGDGILVNAVGASLLPTDGAVRAIGAANAAATRKVQARRSATGRAIELDDVAACVGFLCSPLARNLTGEILTVDGGFSRAYL